MSADLEICEKEIELDFSFVIYRLRNLKRVAKELGETMSDAELMEMIERADTDQDGKSRLVPNCSIVFLFH